jgi:hypothetical protein
LSGGNLGFGAQPAFALEHQRQTSTGGARHHHPAADVLGEAGDGAFVRSPTLTRPLT